MTFGKPIRHLAIAAAAACVCLASAPAWAQREAPSRHTAVQFRPGATEATYRRVLRGWEMHHYRFSARKGQVLNATLDSRSPHVQALVYAIGRNGVAVSPVDDPLQLSQQTLPHSGRYEIRVLQTRNSARNEGAAHPYALTISITHPASAGQGASPPMAAPPPEMNTARWVVYRCDHRRTVRARYHYGEATAWAQVQADGRTTTLGYSPDSNADITVFEGGGLKWSIDNLPPGRKLQARNGMLMRPGTQLVNGQRMAVDEILRKGCDPVR